MAVTPLHMAAENGHADVCQRLIEAGADGLVESTHGHTAYDLATLNRHTAVRCIFEPRASDEDVTDFSHEGSPMLEAAFNGDVDLLLRLVQEELAQLQLIPEEAGRDAAARTVARTVAENLAEGTAAAPPGLAAEAESGAADPVDGVPPASAPELSVGAAMEAAAEAAQGVAAVPAEAPAAAPAASPAAAPAAAPGVPPVPPVVAALEGLAPARPPSLLRQCTSGREESDGEPLSRNSSSKSFAQNPNENATPPRLVFELSMSNRYSPSPHQMLADGAIISTIRRVGMPWHSYPSSTRSSTRHSSRHDLLQDLRTESSQVVASDCL